MSEQQPITELLRELNKVLKTFPQFWNDDKLHCSMVVEAIVDKQPDVIRSLLANEKIKSVYGTELDGFSIFDFDKLCRLLKYKEYWANSFTRYRNKIGLTSEGKYLDYSSDVVLDFPFKDCVLEGGMTKEEQGKNEIYYNEIIARDEIDRLFSPKVLTNVKRYSRNNIEENINDFQDGDNLIIKGNNLIALYSLKFRYKGKIKLIYIDPPYNTGNDSFKYNDNFNQSGWLTFMKNRLEVAADLLRCDGFMAVQIDDRQFARLYLLMAEIFGEYNLKTICVKMSEPTGVKMASINNTGGIAKLKEYIILAGKNGIKGLTLEKIPKGKWDSEYKTVCSGLSKDELKFIKDTLNDENRTVQQTEYAEVLSKKLRFSSARDICQTEGSGKLTDDWLFKNSWRIVQFATLTGGARDLAVEKKILLRDNVPPAFIITTSKSKAYLIKGDFNHQTELPRCKILFADEYLEVHAGDFWNDIKTSGLDNEGGVDFKNGKKPEKLLHRITGMATKAGDLVLDFHLGSGTTATVAHKMGRRYIGIEQMDYIKEITVPRLQKVIDGEQGGISRAVNWQGGGSFVCAELMELNAWFVHQIQKAQSYEALEQLFAIMKTEAHLNYQVELENVLSAAYEVDGVFRQVAFSELKLHEQKQLLIEILDKNQLYVNASEMDDSELNISESDKAFTRSFYGQE
ncbi:site-specific DNA-methyltransferase [Salmonella enterica]|nr:site-specific DNA-methyltransferase [Salmonella enterica]